MIVPILGGGRGGVQGAYSPYWIALHGDGSAQRFGTYEQRGLNHPFPIPGKLKNFRGRLSAAPGGANAWTFYVNKNLGHTALTFTITGAAQFGSDLVNEVSVSPGNYMGVELVRTGVPSDAVPSFACDFVPDDPEWTVILAAAETTPQAAGSFWNLNASLSRQNWGWGSASLLMPCAGTLKYLYMRYSVAPTSDCDCTIYVNGVAKSITCTVPNGSQTANDVTHEVHVDAGDRVSLFVDPNGVTSGMYVKWGIGFKPDIYGECPEGMIPSIGCGNGTRWHWVSGYNFDTDSWTFPETNRQQLASYMVVKKMMVMLASASGQDRDFWFRDDGVNTSLHVNVVSPATLVQNLTDTPIIAGDSVINYNTVFTSGGDTVARVSIVLIGLGGPVDTWDARDIKYNDALGVGQLNDDSNIDQVGFDWGTAPGVYTGEVKDGVGAHFAGEFALTMTPLAAGTLHYYRAKAHHTVSGWLYGPELTFTTLPPLPEARTDPPTDADLDSIDAVGNIISTGGDATCDKRGFVYGLTSQPNPGNVAPGASGYDAFSEESGAYGTGSFTIVLGSLTAGKIYYLRAYCHNSYGYHYGSEIRALTSDTVNLLYPVSNFSQGIRFDTSPGGHYPNAPGSGTISHYILCGDPDSLFTPGGIWGFLNGNFVYERNYYNDNMYTDLFNLMNPYRRTEGIVKVKWKARLLRNSYPFADYRRELRTHGVTYSTADLDIPYPFEGIAKICEIFYDNPNTTNPWTLSEADDLIAGVSLGHSGGFGIAACDQVDIYVLWANGEARTDYGLIISGTQQRLVGTVIEDEAEVCEVYFEWGPTVAYGNTTPPQVKTRGETFEAIINAVGPQHFRAVIETECGETFYGADMVSSGGGPFGAIID